MTPAARVVLAFLKSAGNVVLLKPKTKGPTLAIGGRKYILSDYWAMGANVEDDLAPKQGPGARLINVERGSAFRYLWAYDSDKKVLAMWRHSDGDEKVYDQGGHAVSNIYILEKRGQLNRVDHSEFQTIQRFMERKQGDTLKHLKEWAEENATDWERRTKGILQNWFDKYIRPDLDRSLADLDDGAVPLGFKVEPRIPKSPEDQARVFLVTKATKKFDQNKAYDVVDEVEKAPEGADPQAVQWAWNDIIEKVYDEYLR